MDDGSIVTNIHEEKFKVVIVGECGVGKTTLFKNFLEESNDEPTMQDSKLQTIDFRIKSLMVDKQQIKFYVWDTAGQERYRALVSAYFKGCQAVIIVFDLTSYLSFDCAIDIWLKLSREKTQNALIVLVGNKSDQDAQRIFDRANNEQVAKDENVLYMETSALHGIGVQELFLRVAKEIRRMIERGKKQIQSNQIDGLNYTGQNQLIQAEQIEFLDCLTDQQIGILIGGNNQKEKKM